MRAPFALPALALALFAAPRSAAQTAQQPPPVIHVRLHVVDSAKAPVADANVAVVRGMKDNVAQATTDASGNTMLSFLRGEAQHQLVVRKIGFSPGYRFFALAKSDTIAMEMVLARTPVTLAAVKVTAEENLRRKSYHLDADDIENSGRVLVDAVDLFKLRPDMLNSRGGMKACEVPYTQHNGWIENVWVNGRRITGAVDSVVLKRKPTIGITPPIPRPNTMGRRVLAENQAQAHIDTVMSILSLIHPEHIAEVTYHDCFDMSVGKNHSDMAMFIVLKPGVGYSNKLGSYVVSDSAMAAKVGADRIDIGDLPRYRFRLVGIFDGATGDPIDSVEVRDSTSGLHALTTKTGTASLFFVPEGAATIEFHRAQYRDTSIAITISPSDTVPITITLSRKTGTEHRDPQRPTGGGNRRDNLALTDRKTLEVLLGGWPRG